MTWIDKLRQVDIGGRKLIGASFRGAPFLVESVETSGGRRVVSHEFPFRDEPYIEDLGRSGRGFRIDGYLVGDDYAAQRDALLKELEAEGPGELVHPYRGALRASVKTYSYRETTRDGGLVTFSIEFLEAPLQTPAPIAAVDGTASVAAGADVAIVAVTAEFAEQYDVAGMPAFALESAATALANASEALGAALGPVVTVTQEAAALHGKLDVLIAQAVSLVGQPDGLINAFRDTIVGLLKTAASAPQALFEALTATYAADLGAAVLETTSTRTKEAANQVAITSALRRVLAIEAARLAPRVPWESSDAAITARDQLAALLEEQEALAGDTAYPGLVDLRARVMRAVPGARTFARVRTVERAYPVPSILLAYQLYGSCALELDIVARNKARHPAYLSGSLKVLSDG